jgi:hypothetical protein
MWVGTLRRRLLQRQHHVGCGPRGLEPGTRTSWRWRPPGLCDQRYTWVHLFGAVQPVTGRRFALVMPVVSNWATNLFLNGVSHQLAADEHAVMVLDQANWHGAIRLRIPDDITLVPPSYSPELNPVERT